MARDNRSGDAPNIYPLGHPRNPHSFVETVQRVPQPRPAKAPSAAPKVTAPATPTVSETTPVGTESAADNAPADTTTTES